jgi:Ni/Co efflux regulator RcnB
MRILIAVVAVAVLAGCGAETATTAATGAAIKKREIEEGKKTMDRARENIDKALEQGQQRAEKEGEK